MRSYTVPTTHLQGNRLQNTLDGLRVKRGHLEGSTDGLKTRPGKEEKENSNADSCCAQAENTSLLKKNIVPATTAKLSIYQPQL